MLLIKRVLFTNYSTKKFKLQTFKRSIKTILSTMKFINQEEATQIDVDLFNEYKFSVDQLMELAGLSCAHALAKCFPLESLQTNKILVCVGPGNNGGDGLVAARHLNLMGYQPEIYYPKQTNKELYHNLTHQCKSMGLEFIESVPDLYDSKETYSVILDALFGFTFKPPVRTEFIEIMKYLTETLIPIASIDIPSGWDVEKGPSNEYSCLEPELLISLTAPKMCARYYKGSFHYLGGRFIPWSLAEKYQLMLPKYEGLDCVVALH